MRCIAVGFPNGIVVHRLQIGAADVVHFSWRQQALACLYRIQDLLQNLSSLIKIHVNNEEGKLHSKLNASKITVAKQLE